MTNASALHRIFLLAGVFLISAFFLPELRAEVRFSSLFSDSAVIQRDQPARIRGEASPGEQVTVQLAGKSAAAQADKNGIWSVMLEPLPAGGPYELTVTGKKSSQTLNDIYIGDVWLCIGADRMAQRGSTSLLPDELAEQVHILPVEAVFAEKPKTSISARWQAVQAKNSHHFSAMAVAFGVKTAQKVNVPIGLITAFCEDSSAEAWADLSYFDEIPLLERLAENDRNKLKPQSQQSGLLWNGTLAPLTRLSIRGILYEQGEANIGRAYQYRTLVQTMFGTWRDRWNLGDFPIYFAEAGPFETERTGMTESAAAELRESQRRAEWMRRVRGVVTLDLTGPDAAVKIGERLAALAIWDEYQSEDLGTGPKLRDFKIENGRAVLSFDFIGGGLELAANLPADTSTADTSIESADTGFVLAGEDERFFPAEAHIEGDQVILSSKFVSRPVTVRYHWSDCSTGELRNTEGFPAEAFRTDSRPGLTEYNR